MATGTLERTGTTIDTRLVTGMQRDLAKLIVKAGDIDLRRLRGAERDAVKDMRALLAQANTRLTLLGGTPNAG